MRHTTPLTLLVLAALGWVAPFARSAEPAFCEIYAVGHFGNWYEVAGVNEMRRVLTEAKHWGFNRYGDWFDARCAHIGAPKRQRTLIFTGENLD